MIIERTNNTIRNTIWGFVNKLVSFCFDCQHAWIGRIGVRYSNGI